MASHRPWLPNVGRGRQAFSPSQGLPYPRQGGGVGFGARRNEGRDAAQRSSGCSNGPWVTSVVSLVLLGATGKEALEPTSQSGPLGR